MARPPPPLVGLWVAIDPLWCLQSDNSWCWWYLASNQPTSPQPPGTVRRWRLAGGAVGDCPARDLPTAARMYGRRVQSRSRFRFIPSGPGPHAHTAPQLHIPTLLLCIIPSTLSPLSVAVSVPCTAQSQHSHSTVTAHCTASSLSDRDGQSWRPKMIAATHRTTLRRPLNPSLSLCCCRCASLQVPSA